MKSKNLKKAIAIGISSMVMTGLLTSTTVFAASEIKAGQQYVDFVGTGTAEAIKAGNAKIKIKNNGYNSHAKYTAYKVLDAEISGTVYKYKATSNFESLFTTGGYSLSEGGSIKKGATEITTNSELAKEFAYAVEKQVEDGSLTGEEFNVDENKELAPGYYLIVQTGSTAEDAWVPSLPILVDLPQKSGNDYIYETTVDPKGGYPEVTKEIGAAKTKTDISIGDDVEYNIKADITKYSKNAKDITYKVIDTLSKGLTYNDDAVIKAGDKVLEKDTDYTVNSVKNSDGTTTVTFDFKYDNIKTYDEVLISYTSKLNKDAVIGEVGNKNEVILEYTNNPRTASKATTTPSIPRVYTYGIAVKKVDQNTPTKKLKEAQFGIYTNEDCTVELSGKGVLETQTASDGYQKFSGLDAGTYYIKEKVAPSGYVKSDKVLKIEIQGLDKEGKVTTKEDDLTGKAKYTISVVGDSDPSHVISFIVENDADGKGTVTAATGTSLTGEYNLDKLGLAVVGNVEGVELPKTGGAGTWMFTIGGIALMAGAVTVFAVNKKKEEN